MTVQSLADRLTRDLLSFSREIERERGEFQLEKSELEQKLFVFEAQSEVKDRTIRDLTRRVALLEFALRRDAGISDQLPEPKISAPEISGFVLEALRRPPVRSCRAQISEFLANLEISDRTSVRLRLVRRLAVALEAPTRFAISDFPKFPLITGGGDGAVFLWSEISDAPRGLRGHEGPVTCGVVHRKSGTFFSAGVDGTIRKFSDQCDAVAFAHSDAVWCLAVDEEFSDLLISGGADRRLAFTSLTSLAVESEILLDHVPIAINFHSNHIFVLSEDGDISVFDRKSLRPLPSVPAAHGGPATAAAVVGNFYCVALKSGNLAVYDFRSEEIARKTIAIATAPLTAVVSAFGGLAAVGDFNGDLRLIDLESELCLDLVKFEAKVENLHFSRSLLVALADGSMAELVLQQ